MHYKAQEKVTSDRKSVVSLIPAFLLLDTDELDHADIDRFLDIMSEELPKGNSFDVLFIEECRYYLKETLGPTFGAGERELSICDKWLPKLDEMEKQNIVNTHKNQSRAKIVLPPGISDYLLEVLKEQYNCNANSCFLSLEFAEVGR